MKCGEGEGRLRGTMGKGEPLAHDRCRLLVEAAYEMTTETHVEKYDQLRITLAVNLSY